MVVKSVGAECLLPGSHLVLLNVIFVILGKLEGQFLPDKCFRGVSLRNVLLAYGSMCV